MEIEILKKGQKITGVITMIECFIQENKIFIVMPLLNGYIDLFDYISKNQKLCENTAKKILCDVIKTIMQCHKEGIVHRDIKDENILINEDTLETKLIDFGSGILTYKLNNLRKCDNLFGTQVFNPPECIKSEYYTLNGFTVWTIGRI